MDHIRLVVSMLKKCEKNPGMKISGMKNGYWVLSGDFCPSRLYSNVRYSGSFATIFGSKRSTRWIQPWKRPNR